MTRDEFDRYCASLKATTQVIQWGGASVWKVGGRIFAICSDWGQGVVDDAISFKCSDLAFQILSELEGIRPAPYLARAKWVQVMADGALSDDDLRSYVEDAHGLIAAKLIRKARAELGLH